MLTQKNYMKLEFPARSVNEGFARADVAQARTPMYTTGGEERSGMGFTIMESFMDTLRVKSVPGRGTTVTMCRRIRRRA